MEEELKDMWGRTKGCLEKLFSIGKDRVANVWPAC